MPETAPETPAEGSETPALDWDALRSQWEQEDLTPDKVAEALKNSRKWEDRAKANKKALDEALPKVKQLETLAQVSRTAEEQLADWQNRTQSLQTKLVSSQIKSLAASNFADPTDALAALGDAGRYLGLDDEIDEAAIKADLDALLERKPHWRKTDGTPSAPATPRVPAPNPAQGSGVDGRPANNPADQFAALIRNQLTQR